MQITFEGHQIGSYTLLDEIGRGGTARVYRASRPDTSQLFAIKLVNALTSSDSRYEERFQREVDVIRRLNHPGILPVFDSGRTEDGTLYMVMPLIEGGTLKTYFFRRPVLAPAQAQMILSQIGPALDYAHEQGIIHRDVKPHNIMLMGDGKVCLADFGIAHLLSLDTTMGSLTTTGAAIGTFAYMSPEQVSGHGLDGRSDIYSLGIVMYQALVGRMPFSGDTTATIISQQLHARPISPRKVNPDFPAEMEAVLDHSMAKSADERFQTGAAFVQAFDESLRALPEEMRNHPLVTTDQVEAAADLSNDALLTSTVILPATPRQRITRWGLAILALLLVVCGVSTFVIRPLQTQLQNAQGTANALASRTPMIIVVTDATGKTIYIQVTATGEAPQGQTPTSTARPATDVPTATATVPSATPEPTNSPVPSGGGTSGGTIGGTTAGATTGGTTAGTTTGGTTAGTTTGGTTTTGTGTAGTGGTTAGNTGGTTAGNTGGTTAGNTGGTTAGNTGTGGGAAGGNPNTPKP